MGLHICRDLYLGLDNAQWKASRKYKSTVEPGYNKPQESDILCYKLIPHC